MNKKTITLIKEKNEWAFEELYNEYKNLVYYVIFKLSKIMMLQTHYYKILF